MKTRVYITIDTECAEERHASDPPMGWDVRVWGRFANQRRALGIELIMAELAATGTRATFFVEALGAAFFGEAELAKACGAMLRAGHDVQLHTHPVQIRANYRTLGEPPANDDIGSYSVADQVRLLTTGLDTLARCGVPRESLRAFRAGNYGASNATWDAMPKAGLVLSSNYNPSYTHRCTLDAPHASAGLFRDDATGVWELPITVISSAGLPVPFRPRLGGTLRHAQITALSGTEFRALLDDAHAAGVSEITIVTHSFELYHVDSIEPPRGRLNTLNVLRLREICRHVADNPERFAIDTCGDLAARLASGAETPAPDPRLPIVRGHERHRARRLVEQTLKRIEARTPWLPGVIRT